MNTIPVSPSTTALLQQQPARTSAQRPATADAATQQPSPSTIVTLSGQSPDTDDQTGSDDGQPSKVKSFAYGVVGMGAPKTEQQEQTQNPEEKTSESFYTAGRVVAAALTVGTLLSVLA